MDAEHDELWRECEGNSVCRWGAGMGARTKIIGL